MTGIPGERMFWRLVRSWRRLTWTQRIALVLAPAVAVTSVVLIVNYLQTPSQIKAGEYDGRTWLRADEKSMVLINGITGQGEAKADVQPQEGEADPPALTVANFVSSLPGRTVLQGNEQVLVIDDGSQSVTATKTGRNGAVAAVPGFLVINADKLVARRISGAQVGEAELPLNVGADDRGPMSMVSDGTSIWAMRKGANGPVVLHLRATRDASLLEIADIRRSIPQSAERLALVDGRPYLVLPDRLQDLVAADSKPRSDGAQLPEVADQTGGLWATATTDGLKMFARGSSTPKNGGSSPRAFAIWAGEVWYVDEAGALFRWAPLDDEPTPVDVDEGQSARFAPGAPQVFVDGGRLWINDGSITATIDTRRRVTWINLTTVSKLVGCDDFDCGKQEDSSTTGPDTSQATSTTVPTGDPPPSSVPPLASTTSTTPKGGTTTTAAPTETTTVDTVVDTTNPLSTDAPPPITDPPPDTTELTTTTMFQGGVKKGSLVASFSEPGPIVAEGGMYPSVVLNVGYDGKVDKCEGTYPTGDGELYADGVVSASGAVSSSTYNLTVRLPEAGDGKWTTQVAIEVPVPVASREVRISSIDLCGLKVYPADLRRLVSPIEPQVGEIIVLSSGEQFEGTQGSFKADLWVPLGWEPAATWSMAGPCSYADQSGDVTLQDGISGNTSAFFDYGCAGDHTVQVIVTFANFTSPARSLPVGVSPSTTTTTTTAPPTTAPPDPNDLLVISWGSVPDTVQPGDSVTAIATFTGTGCKNGDDFAWAFSGVGGGDSGSGRTKSLNGYEFFYTIPDGSSSGQLTLSVTATCNKVKSSRAVSIDLTVLIPEPPPTDAPPDSTPVV